MTIFSPVHLYPNNLFLLVSVLNLKNSRFGHALNLIYSYFLGIRCYNEQPCYVLIIRNGNV